MDDKAAKDAIINRLWVQTEAGNFVPLYAPVGEYSPYLRTGKSSGRDAAGIAGGLPPVHFPVLWITEAMKINGTVLEKHLLTVHQTPN